MPTIQNDSILDDIASTLDDLGRAKWTDLYYDLQEYIALPNILKKEQVKFAGGAGIRRNIMIDTTGNARHVGLFAQDSTNISDVLHKLRVPWRHTTTSYAFDEREEEFNSGEAEIVDLIKIRRTDGMASLAMLLEDTWWSKPADSSDEVTPFGIDYWFVPNASEGFFGGNPAGFSAGAANVDSSAYTRWKNYTARYAAVSKDDLILKMRRAYRRIMFKPPVPNPNYARGADRYRIYVNNDTLEGMETIGESQNENLGKDLAPYQDQMVFKSVPIQWVPALDANEVDPVYMTNWAHFYPFFQKNEYLKESGPLRKAGQHRVIEVHIDLTWNTLCTNRRRQALITK